ncbi:hypothetical protein HZA97_02755 [Candidatus Woesearchaeota archaeon]|nr:hypothetical protein [Candidatus Woesearchaeota archaeon]
MTIYTRYNLGDEEYEKLRQFIPQPGDVFAAGMLFVGGIMLAGMLLYSCLKPEEKSQARQAPANQTIESRITDSDNQNKMETTKN